MANKFTLSENLQQKWLSAIDKQIHVFIYNTFPVKYRPMLWFDHVVGSEIEVFQLQFPIFPRNIEELKVIRYWLEQMFRCDYNTIHFNEHIFNPEMFNLVFDNEEIAKLIIKCRKIRFFFFGNIDFWKFTLDRLVVSEKLIMKFNIAWTTEGDNYILLELLSKEGYRIPMVEFESHNYLTLFYNLLVINLENSTDLSKVVAKIKFDCDLERFSRSNLIVKGVEMNESSNTKILYKITNIHDSKMKFSVLWELEEEGSDSIKIVEIAQLK